MKKLNLKLNDIKEMLTKEQMKNITGGYWGPCTIACNKDKTCDSKTGDCKVSGSDYKWIQCDGKDKIYC
jgi:natural product precursor